MKNMHKMLNVALGITSLFALGCSTATKSNTPTETSMKTLKPAVRVDSAAPSLSLGSGAFSQDVAFMQQHTSVVLLQDGDASVAIAPDYQGRVMTSTYDLLDGPSFGWINRPVIEQGVMTAEEAEGKLEEHIYIFGGEERFWLGPEGGQFGLYFKPGDKFEFADWKTPAVIDTEPFELVEKTATSARFVRDAELVNYSGTTLKMSIERTIRLLDEEDTAELLDVELPEGVRLVAYESDNCITNTGSQAWKPETGLPSIWILGMYNPSPETTIVIPFNKGGDKVLGPKVNDTYFGAIPEDYLRVQKGKLFFRADGTRRGKIGVSPMRSKGVAGSYDAGGQVLNLITYNVQEAPSGYVNSMWEFQDEPYAGDAINAYNDGAPEPGADPLGPFYELETSSPAAELKPGESMRHVQRTFHIQGSEADLDPLARRFLGAKLNRIKNAF